MTAGSDEDLVETTIARPRPPADDAAAPPAPQPWATGRHKKPRPPVPTLPARAVFVRPVVSHRPPPRPIDLSAPRPRVVDDVSLLGFSRFSRGRVGSRLFRLFFLLVFVGIFAQFVYSIVEPLVR